MKHFLLPVLLSLFLFSCEKETDRPSSPPKERDYFIGTINGDTIKLNEETDSSFIHSFNRGSGSSTTDTIESAFGAIFQPLSKRFYSVEIYFSFFYDQNLLNPNRVQFGAFVFQEDSTFHNIFKPGNKRFLYDIPLTSSSNIPSSQNLGVYIILTDRNFKKWRSFTFNNGTLDSKGLSNNFEVLSNDIINLSHNYVAGNSDPNPFRSVKVKGKFNCELYPINSTHTDIIEIKDAEFSAIFRE
tara:strand:+ start:175 stop:900 length:726 start_codon:yes stop_codon:yes gene_type:complete